MNIGEAARLSGVSARMARHYETLGLVAGVARSEAGYRQYDEHTVHTLRFIRRARELGFEMDEVANLLALWRNQARPSAEVKRIALAHVDDLQRRIAGLQSMQQTLQRLASCCHGDARPDCPILDDLADGPAPTSGAAPRRPPTSRRAAGSSSARAVRGR